MDPAQAMDAERGSGQTGRGNPWCGAAEAPELGRAYARVCRWEQARATERPARAVRRRLDRETLEPEGATPPLSRPRTEG
jgi:hypothetical protein